MSRLPLALLLLLYPEPSDDQLQIFDLLLVRISLLLNLLQLLEDKLRSQALLYVLQLLLHLIQAVLELVAFSCLLEGLVLIVLLLLPLTLEAHVLQLVLHLQFGYLLLQLALLRDLLLLAFVWYLVLGLKEFLL